MTDTSQPIEEQRSELAPCPFCGGKAHISGNGGRPRDRFYWAACEICDSEGPCERSEISAIERWNTRRASSTPRDTREWRDAFGLDLPHSILASIGYLLDGGVVSTTQVLVTIKRKCEEAIATTPADSSPVPEKCDFGCDAQLAAAMCPVHGHARREKDIR